MTTRLRGFRGGAAPAARSSCRTCGEEFPSKTAMFKHLRGNGGGTACSATAKSNGLEQVVRRAKTVLLFGYTDATQTGGLYAPCGSGGGDEDEGAKGGGGEAGGASVLAGAAAGRDAGKDAGAAAAAAAAATRLLYGYGSIASPDTKGGAKGDEETLLCGALATFFADRGMSAPSLPQGRAVSGRGAGKKGSELLPGVAAVLDTLCFTSEPVEGGADVDTELAAAKAVKEAAMAVKEAAEAAAAAVAGASAAAGEPAVEVVVEEGVGEGAKEGTGGETARVGCGGEGETADQAARKGKGKGNGKGKGKASSASSKASTSTDTSGNRANWIMEAAAAVPPPKDDPMVSGLNALLPPTIRVFARATVPQLFRADRNCFQRHYEYMLPLSVILGPATTNITTEVAEAATDEGKRQIEAEVESEAEAARVKNRRLLPAKAAGGSRTNEEAEAEARAKYRQLKKIMRRFRGDHIFLHNYSKLHLPSDPCVERRIVSFAHAGNEDITCTVVDTPTVDTPASSERKGEAGLTTTTTTTTYAILEVSGDQFVCEQVLRMVGTALAVLHGYLPDNFIEVRYDEHQSISGIADNERSEWWFDGGGGGSDDDTIYGHGGQSEYMDMHTAFTSPQYPIHCTQVYVYV